MSDPLDPAFQFDPLESALNITGAENVSDRKTSALGFLLMQENRKERDALLMERGDTLFNNKLDRYITIIESVDFENVFELPFVVNDYDNKPRDETYFVYARRDGLVLSFDTFHGDEVNGGNLYYQWEPRGKFEHGSHLSSGGLCRDESRHVWIGSHDAREGLLRIIDMLSAKGNFLNPWLTEKQSQSLWLLHHGDTTGDFGSYDSHAIAAERIQRMPQWVQDMIGSYTRSQAEVISMD
jgi:hypothetical protein